MAVKLQTMLDMDMGAFHLTGVGAVQALSLLLLEHKFLVRAIRKATR